MSFVSSNTKLIDHIIFSRFNGASFKTEPSSKFPHYYVMGLGSYRNSPFVTGHLSSTNGLKTEILDYDSQKWEQLADYPFSTGNRYVHQLIQRNFNNFFNQIHFSIAYYATASTPESVLIIGGYTYGSPSTISIIAEYKNGSWTNIGNLAQARYGHCAITSGSITMVVGGDTYSGSS